MRPQASDSLAAWPAEITTPNGGLVLTGYGLQVRVWRGRLRVADGIGRDRREVLVHRATGRLRRLVVLGHTGSISLDAIRWLADVGAGFLQIDADGRVQAAFGPQGTDRPGLRRAQATALATPRGDDIARRLIAEKIAAQAEVLATVDRVAPVGDEVIDALRRASASLHVAESSTAVLRAEADAAVAYWSAWSGLPVRFAPHDVGRVPDHWRTFGSRSSALTGQPRAATNPANAMLNYLYALLESEVTLACRIVGLDPGLGILHVDTPHRASLSADLMEPLRPHVDRYLLGLLTRRTLGSRDFFETRTGTCRVVAPLTHELAESIGQWERLALPLAQDVARLLVGGERGGDGYRRPRKTAAPLAAEKRSPTTSAPRVRTPRPRCVVCGTPVRRRSDRTCGPACEKQARVSAGHAGGAKLAATMQRLRDEGRDPAATPEARANLAASMTRRRAEQRAWDLANPERPGPDGYRREILPVVERMSLNEIRDATGLSKGYCARVRRGEIVPHPRWWEALRGI